VNTFATELDSRYTHMIAMTIRLMTMLATAGVENRGEILLRISGSTRRLAIR
jgi:hypothetical protein